MKFIKIKVFKEDRFSNEQEEGFGKYAINFPVFNGLAEYSEFYEISESELNISLRTWTL
jgi:hypothetical protein